MKRTLLLLVIVSAIIGLSGTCFAQTAATSKVISDIQDVQNYERAIHIMAMLLVGFGFLMVFVKRYGRSALTATYLMVSSAIPLYFLKDNLGIFGKPSSDVQSLIMAEFAAASLLICAGAVLGRLKMQQYLLLGILFIPCYALNEWILLRGGFNTIPIGAFVDTGGSILIHAFGALFGLAAILSLTSTKEFKTPIESDETSDRISMMGSMVLWVFWPSFCAALAAPGDVSKTAVNVILALCGSTLATYAASHWFRKKISIADIANAALAGGVAIGSTCDKVGTGMAFAIGILAGVLSTVGFAVIQAKLQQQLKSVDTCGVLYLHGLPGLLGGFAAIFAVKGISVSAQLVGIGIAVSIALVAGFVAGKVVALFGKRLLAYEDSEEFMTE